MQRGVLFLVCMAVGVPALAQNSKLAGDYSGMLGPYHVKLHLVADQTGKLRGTADSPDQGVMSMNCETIRAEGQTLSFMVPMVQGTWTGIVSADGNTLAGLWSQGASPVPLSFTKGNNVSQPTGVISAPASSASADAGASDYVFKPLPGGAMTQVFQQGNMVGNIMNINGQLRVVARPGADSGKIQKAYQDYLASNPAAAPTAIAGATLSTMPIGAAAPAIGRVPVSLGMSNGGKADPSGIRFDGKTVTVPRTDGMTVVFAGDDVTIARGNVPMYVLRRKKASVGRAFEQSLEHSHAIGGGIAGGGVEFLRAGGGLIYDSGMGSYDVQESPGVREAKQLALIAMDAIDAVRLMPGHSDFKPSGYGAMKEVSGYRLRSDGSR